VEPFLVPMLALLPVVVIAGIVAVLNKRDGGDYSGDWNDPENAEDDRFLGYPQQSNGWGGGAVDASSAYDQRRRP
jgi:hypothetical protein